MKKPSKKVSFLLAMGLTTAVMPATAQAGALEWTAGTAIGITGIISAFIANNQRKTANLLSTASKNLLLIGRKNTVDKPDFYFNHYKNRADELYSEPISQAEFKTKVFGAVAAAAIVIACSIFAKKYREYRKSKTKQKNTRYKGEK